MKMSEIMPVEEAKLNNLLNNSLNELVCDL